MARQPKQEKQPHLAWRITRTVLDVLGKIILVLLIAVGTVALIAAIAGSIAGADLDHLLYRPQDGGIP